MNRIIAFDVETPNHFNNSICSIGIARVENGRIIENQHYLVDPEAWEKYICSVVFSPFLFT